MGQVHQQISQQKLEFAQLTHLVEQLMYQMKHTQERHESEQRQLLLEVENRMLRAERGLPPAPSQTERTG